MVTRTAHKLPTARPVSLLDMSKRAGFDRYVELCTAYPDVDRDDLIAQMHDAFALHSVERSSRTSNTSLQRTWYESLERGDPDYSIYDDPRYLADLWECWINSSRDYLSEAARKTSLGSRSMIASLAFVRSVVDLGCGIGFSTAALASLFPYATIIGTNLPGRQLDIAAKIATSPRVRFVTDLGEIPRPVDLVFGSEYFEHFPAPVAHLRDVVDALTPSALLTASTFTIPAVGHFHTYRVDGRDLSGAAVSRAFSSALTGLGYQRIRANVWNDRPQLWVGRDRVKDFDRE
jgi:SAM-dependent methyltransferase